ncbi:hypothetical protein EBB54_11930 [Schaedlerella arabinosiphila]|uniref:Uncharacterized protein n=1 Tax=Schaedlerella arabinosiphila TaxID=2044587 RepID=A0A3R8KZX0_9FIRM|nr:hypothetical protein [Schaedlerella arabinosiphila]RRK32002.1 hypothetical protein EBB54_11930 [Schaedlerella arabinosiphila]
MINDMKLGIRLLRYGFGIKTNLVLLIVCTAADLLCFALELAGITTPLDGFMLLACVIPVQILFTLNVVDIVLTSPARKKLQTSVPAVMTLCTTLAAYLIVVLKEAVIVLIHPDKTAQSAMRLVFLGVLVAVIMAFTGVLYKSFPALLVMYFSLSGFISFFMMPILRSDFLGEDRGSLVRAARIGVVLILAGGALEYALSVLFYKKPVSKKVLGERLSREL